MILHALADAFVSVSVLVAALFVLFGWLRVRWGTRFEALIAARRTTGPVLAVIATFPPGCIGVLAISRLYVNGVVSYGTVIAALVSTMGDAAWLLIATEPQFTLLLKLGFAVLGGTVGLAIDYLGVRPPERSAPVGHLTVGVANNSASQSGVHPPAKPSSSHVCLRSLPPVDMFTESDGAIKPPTVPGGTTGWSKSMVLFLVCLVSGLVLSVPVTFHVMPEDVVEIPALIVGVLGTGVAIVVVLASRGRFVCGEEVNQVEQTMPEVLRNCGREAAFVTVWVGAVFTVWEVVASHGWLGDGTVALKGILGVLIASAAGMIPACGVEILMSALFVAGILPAPALVAYLLSQDGNGFIPIATRRPRAALHAMFLTTLLGLGVGLLVLVLL